CFRFVKQRAPPPRSGGVATDSGGGSGGTGPVGGPLAAVPDADQGGHAGHVLPPPAGPASLQPETQSLGPTLPRCHCQSPDLRPAAADTPSGACAWRSSPPASPAPTGVLACRPGRTPRPPVGKCPTSPTPAATAGRAPERPPPASLRRTIAPPPD